MNELVTTNADAYRASTDAAALCKAIVVASAQEIQGKSYVKVEGWQAIAVAHGCTASARNVERIEGGVRAVGEIRRMSDGVVIAEAEGFVGEDEATWFGGTARKWKWGQKRGEKIWYDEEMPKRADYAIRAMAQTRAISRACRSAFAHVVVMMNADLQTTPAEEVPFGGFDNGAVIEQPPSSYRAKKDGLGPRAAELMHEIADLESPAACTTWNNARSEEIRKMPTTWQNELQDAMDAQWKLVGGVTLEAEPA